MTHHTTPASRRATTLVAGALLAALAAGPALAHSGVTSTSPARGATLDRVPARMAVTFSEAVGRAGTMTVTRNGTGNLARGARISPKNARTVLVTLRRPGPKKQAGRYRLTWRVTAADGHALTGTVSFTVR